MNIKGALWIDGIPQTIDEKSVSHALRLLGQEGVVSIKIIKNKFTGKTASHGIIQFESDSQALMAMYKLNGRIIPNSQPPIRFQLSHAGSQFINSDRQYAIWVSDLPSSLSEESFHRLFSTRYSSVCLVKIVGKGHGFVRFQNENDHRDALIHMNGFNIPNEGPIKVSITTPIQCLESAAKLSGFKNSSNFSHFYEDYWLNKGALTNFGMSKKSLPFLVSTCREPMIDLFMLDDEEDEAESRLIEYDVPINVDALNTKFIEESEEVWTAVENDRWLFCFDVDHGIAPGQKIFKNTS